jgi:hypothetical protein
VDALTALTEIIWFSLAGRGPNENFGSNEEGQVLGTLKFRELSGDFGAAIYAIYSFLTIFEPAKSGTSSVNSQNSTCRLQEFFP